MRKLTSAAITALLMAPGLAMSSAASADTSVSFASGVEFSSGDYGGTEDTEVVRVPLIARFITDNWDFRVSAPYLSVTGPANVADPDDPNGGTIVRTGTETGIGDTTLEVTRNFKELGGSDAYVDVTAWARLPTGDDARGLGNGATDYALIGEVGTSGDNGGAFVSAGRRFLGDDGGATPREDGWQARLGGWVGLGERTRLGGAYTWREASRQGRKDPSDVGAYVSFRMLDQLVLAINGGVGLSDASADYRAGVRLTWRSEDFGQTER